MGRLSLLLIGGVVGLVVAVADCHARTTFAPDPPPALDFDGHRFVYADLQTRRVFSFDLQTSSLTVESTLPDHFWPMTLACAESGCYVGGAEGAFLFQHGEWRAVPELSKIRVNAFRACGKAVWAATDRGLFEVERFHVKRHIEKKDGLANAAVYGLLCDGDRLYAGTYFSKDQGYGQDMYGTDDINVVNLGDGGVSRLKFPPASRMPDVVGSRYGYVIDQVPESPMIRIEAWAYWGVTDDFELDPRSGEFRTAKAEPYYYFQSISRRYHRERPGILADYLHFIDKLKSQGSGIYSYGAGGNVPGDVREYFELKYAVEPQSVPALYEASADWVKQHVGPVLKSHHDPLLDKIIEASAAKP